MFTWHSYTPVSLIVADSIFKSHSLELGWWRTLMRWSPLNTKVSLAKMCRSFFLIHDTWETNDTNKTKTKGKMKKGYKSDETEIQKIYFHPFSMYLSRLFTSHFHVQSTQTQSPTVESEQNISTDIHKNHYLPSLSSKLTFFSSSTSSANTLHLNFVSDTGFRWYEKIRKVRGMTRQDSYLRISSVSEDRYNLNVW